MADDEVTLWNLLGAQDNLSEPVPIWNKKTTMVAMTASFIVSFLAGELFLSVKGGDDDAPEIRWWESLLLADLCERRVL